MKIMITAVAIVSASLGLPRFALAESTPNAPYISISGQGNVQAQPDMATLVIDVRVAQAQASDAKKQVDARVAHYFDFLHQQGITDKEINAANVVTDVQYDDSDHGKPKQVGYQASRHVTVTLHQLSKLNTLLDGALAAGLNEIRSVSMGVEHPEHYQQQARQAAIRDALVKAKEVAAGFNATLGSVWSIDYQTPPSQMMPRIRMMSVQASATQTTPDHTYQQQKLDFSDKVDVVFTLNTHSLGAEPDDHTPPTNP
ncbi:oxidative stress defense protein [Rosenbergiella australiborealis]|uniref:Oxidative stress defense protein n=1 Tax=Rosenbergiella australiborealis TaxID=1544696 RepID=A0ABS5T686_9GAMM|nr:oxidative stress defense protein [Rosenbergiella australiborealis]MBT0727867.1 oxidative stress defense protein [Rosenbergiella australiborealis]